MSKHHDPYVNKRQICGSSQSGHRLALITSRKLSWGTTIKFQYPIKLPLTYIFDIIFNSQYEIQHNKITIECNITNITLHQIYTNSLRWITLDFWTVYYLYKTNISLPFTITMKVYNFFLPIFSPNLGYFNFPISNY